MLSPDPGDGSAGLRGQRLDHVAGFLGNPLVDQGANDQHRDHVTAVLDGDDLQALQTFAFELLHDNRHRSSRFRRPRRPGDRQGAREEIRGDSREKGVKADGQAVVRGKVQGVRFRIHQIHHAAVQAFILQDDLQ